MNNKLKRTLATSILTALVVAGNTSTAFAQSTTELASYSGNEIECTLNTSWVFCGTDTATAKSNWKGMKGYQVKVKLQQCQNAFDSYHTLDTDYGDKTAIVKGAKIGVWKFRSFHAAYSKSKKSAKRVHTMTDW